MEIKERIYTLEKWNKGIPDSVLCLKRDGKELYCPFASETENPIECSEECPAFEISELRVTYNGITSEPTGEYIVNLKCFPQPVSFEIQEVPDGSK